MTTAAGQVAGSFVTQQITSGAAAAVVFTSPFRQGVILSASAAGSYVASSAALASAITGYPIPTGGILIPTSGPVFVFGTGQTISILELDA